LTKSTLCSFAYPIWAIVGKQKKKFVLLLTQTQIQARLLLGNIKRELENNELLKADIGPFEEERNEWAATSLVLSRYNARIMVASSEQSVRGLRHEEYRPDVIVADDIEDMASVKTQEGRDKTYHWFGGDVIPAGASSTKIIVVGNLLHEDSLIMRLKNNITERHMDGIFHAYPILDETDTPLWLGKYPNSESVQKEKQKIGNEVSWQREYMLKIIPDGSQIIYPEWIQYYEKIPDLSYFENGYRFSAIGIDLAISEKTTADYTAMIAAYIFGHKDDLRIYISPNPINARLPFPETVTKTKDVAGTLQGNQTKIFIEKVAYQQALVDQLKEEGYRYAEGVPIHGEDKRSRLILTTDFIHTGKVLFPKNGAELLIQQLVRFGIEKHDDLADAFSILILKIIEISAEHPSISFAPLDIPMPNPNQPFSDYFNHSINWNNPEARASLEKEADLQIMRDELQRAKNGW
jgi:predicted phage terminase large subunit-like protein